MISALISKGWICIRALTSQSPRRKQRWAPRVVSAGGTAELWAAPSCTCQVCCDTRVGVPVTDLRRQGEPEEALVDHSSARNPCLWLWLALGDGGTVLGDCPCLRGAYVPFSGWLWSCSPEAFAVDTFQSSEFQTGNSRRAFCL